MSPSSEYTRDAVELFKSEDGRLRLEVRLEGDSVWLTQPQMAQLFARKRSVITKLSERVSDRANG
jgi:hypothetical protein